MKRLVLITLGLVCALIVVLSIHVQSKTKKLDPEMRYISYMIEKGDTLEGIEIKFNTSNSLSRKDYIEKLVQINGLDNEIIHEGRYLTIVTF